MKIRAFLAFDISEDVKVKLAKLLSDFSSKEKGVKWVSPNNMHVTIKFFGSVEEDLLLGELSRRIEEVLTGTGSAVLLCEGIGIFPNWKYPKVLWAGFTGDTEKVIDMQKRVDDALATYELRRDKREFRLHLTLGRAKGILKKSPLTPLVEKLGPVKFGEVKIEKFILYKSVLTKGGSIYTPLKEFKL